MLISRPLRVASMRKSDRSGTTMVEFAVVAPVFFIMVMGLFEFSRALMIQSMLAGAAQQGARAGTLGSAQSSDVTTAVNNYLTTAGISGASTSVSPNPPSSAYPGQNVTVTVSIPYASVSWLPSPTYLANVTLSSKALAPRESGQ